MISLLRTVPRNVACRGGCNLITASSGVDKWHGPENAGPPADKFPIDRLPIDKLPDKAKGNVPLVDNPDLDIVVANGFQSNQLLTNDSSGNFTVTDLPGGALWRYNIALGDIDDDGDLDASSSITLSPISCSPTTAVAISPSPICLEEHNLARTLRSVMSMATATSTPSSAAKEVFEETGLLIEVGRFLVDTERTESVCRYFLGRRIGGDPSNMGWEAQAVCLIPVELLPQYVTHENDVRVIEAIEKLGVGAWVTVK